MPCFRHQTNLAELPIDMIRKSKIYLCRKNWFITDKKIHEAQREAEVKQESLPHKDRDHALFVAFAPYKSPQYAISVLVEHGGSGGKAAAPIAKKVIKKVLERHELRRSINNQIESQYNASADRFNLH